jgi:hypothetical protein
MTSKTLISFVFIFSYFLSIAQSSDFKIVRGPEYEGKRSTIESVIGNTEEGVIVCRKEKKDMFLEILSSKATVVKSVSLSGLTYKKLEKDFVGGFIIGGNLYLRFSARDKKAKMLYTFIDKYNIQTLAFEENVRQEEIDLEASKSVYWYGIGLGRALSEYGENGFHKSNDSKYIVEYSSDFEKDKDTPENLTVSVFDSNMKEMWKKEYKMPYSNDNFQIVKVIADDFGNTHLLGKEYPEGRKKSKRGEQNYKYHVISFLDKGATMKDNVLDLNTKFITDCTIGITNDQHLLTTGFYSNKGMFSIDGAFSMTVDLRTQKVLGSNVKEFEKEFIQMGMTDREKKKSDRKEEKGKDLEMPEFDLDHLVLLPDGGWVLLAEQFYITEKTFTTTSPNGGTSTRTVTYFHYDDIIAVKMTSTGEIEWNAKITKNQSASGYLTILSYLWNYCENEFQIVYNSAPMHKENDVKVAKIDNSGSVTISTLMEGGKDELNIHPAYSSRLGDCNMLLYGAKKKTYQFNFVSKK